MLSVDRPGSRQPRIAIALIRGAQSAVSQYNYGEYRRNLFGAELTGCSTSTDSCHSVDG
jgi:hypothetical protein